MQTYHTSKYVFLIKFLCIYGHHYLNNCKYNDMVTTRAIEYHRGVKLRVQKILLGIKISRSPFHGCGDVGGDFLTNGFQLGEPEISHFGN